MPIRPSRLSEEVKALDAVRRALVLGDHEAALQSLENYVVEFPGGILNQEARVLKIEALLGMGREKEARGLAERFLEQAPDDPQADRVRRLLRQSP
jgi:outer membrane protein assembly factor BamD (BamD/ComL family)